MRRDFVEIRAYCKINLALDILRLREDGYHEVEMILQTIPLWDTVTLRRSERRNFSEKKDTLRL